MKILITGAEGQVGREFTELVSNQNLSKQAPPFEVLPLSRSGLDITQVGQIADIFEAFCPAFVVNTAAYTAVDKAEDEEAAAFEVNCEGPRNLAVECQKRKIPLIHISTDYVFDGNKKSPYTENDIPNPVGVYGQSKLAGELAVQASLNNYYILRTSWVFGRYGANFVKTMLRLAKNQSTINVVADQFGSPTSALQIAEVVLGIINRSIESRPLPPGVYHFGGTPHLSWFEFAQEIFTNVVKNKEYQHENVNPIATSDYPTRAARPKNSRLDNSKLELVMEELSNSDWRKYLQALKNEL